MGDNLVISGRWKIQDQIGFGGQATVHKALDISNNNQVAVKINANAYHFRGLLREKWAYEEIMKKCGGEHQNFIPTLHHYENDGKTEVMVLELMGPSLLNVLEKQGRLFEHKTVIRIFKRSLKCLERLHKTGMAHRDIKPDNICVGRQENMDDIRLIDLGFCTAYIDGETGMYKPLNYRSGLTGTIPYCSLNQQIGGSATRLDDLEALCFSMMCIHSGILPWMTAKGQNATHSEEFDVALGYKSKSAEQICEGFPKVFKEFLQYVRDLSFESEPNYAHLHSILDRAR